MADPKIGVMRNSVLTITAFLIVSGDLVVCSEDVERSASLMQ